MADIDPWDAVLDVESNLYNEGYREGQESAVADGIIDHGRRAGFMKGFAIGAEVGFMESVTRSMEAHDSVVDAVADASAASATNSRLSKRRADVLNRCAALPTTNVNDFDFPEEVRQIRTVFKQSGAPVEFLPRKAQETKPTQEW